MLADPDYYRSTAIAQLLLSKQVKIEPDGKWGSFTQSAYERASASLRGEVDTTLGRLQPPTSATELRAYRNAQRPKSMIATPTDTSDVNGVKALIRDVAAKEGVPVATAMRIAFLESRFKQSAVSPTGAVGVYQLTKLAVKDLKQRANYVADRTDLLQNVTGGIKYMKLAARDLGVRLDQTAEVYMAFNIGPTGAKHVLAGQPKLAQGQIKLQAYGKEGVERYDSNLRAAVNAAPVA